MAKMTKEEKKALIADKKAKAKAKREAKKAARLEKLQKARDKKRAKREAKKAKRIARLEKEKAKKAKLREKKRLAKEKKLAVQRAKNTKVVKTTAVKGVVEIDIREAAKTMKKALVQIANQLAPLDVDKRCKKAKAIRGLGYDVETSNGEVIVKFDATKSKKTNDAPIEVVAPANVEVETIVDDVEEQPVEEAPAVEMVPSGDLYGQDGNPTGEVANLDSEQDEPTDDDGIDDNDSTIPDYRDEQDDDLVESRREFFNSFGEDFEPTDD